LLPDPAAPTLLTVPRPLVLEREEAEDMLEEPFEPELDNELVLDELHVLLDDDKLELEDVLTVLPVFPRA
jgi:hypothetical protein